MQRLFCSCLFLHLSPSLPPPSMFPASLWPWEEYRSSKGNKCAPAAGWEDWVNPPFPPLSLPLPLSRPVCLLLVRENQRRSSPLQPCLRGVWLQRKESEEVCVWGGYWSVSRRETQRTFDECHENMFSFIIIIVFFYWKPHLEEVILCMLGYCVNLFTVWQEKRKDSPKDSRNSTTVLVFLK